MKRFAIGMAMLSILISEVCAETVFTAGDLRLEFEKTPGGVRLKSLSDAGAKVEWLARPEPLFALTVGPAAGGKDEILTADAGWEKAGVRANGSACDLSWEGRDLRVTLQGKGDAKADAVRWTFRVENRSPTLSVRTAVFPQLVLAEPGEGGVVFLPKGPGELRRDAWRRDWRHGALYPYGWEMTMQYLAAYDAGGKAGLYIGAHDPSAATKELSASGKGKEVRFAFETPAADAGIAGNDVTPAGTVVWRLFRGNWYDAARIYRAWAKSEPAWWPKIGPEGRIDTPAWMRDLCVWAQGGGDPNAVRGFAAAMGQPAGYHWYSWHRIPFDNDYPHYLPPPDGFAAMVKTMQEGNARVMPYINGRLWDLRDRGTEDFEFTKVALPAATKGEDGKPFTEGYGGNEADGTPVRFAVMCPTTKLWRDMLRDTVVALTKDHGVNGVYLDQIGAAPPKLCRDKSHGHPLGGGSWWAEGYRKTLEEIRRALPKDKMLTTECNADAYVRGLDGFLVWHWQHPDQVPAFPAVYAGAVQLFGRAFGGGPTPGLAFRMKVGQEFVFGEQVGWCPPDAAGDPERGPFLRQAAALRRRLVKYFAAGEMARPPRLEGRIPRVRADWQWQGEKWVEEDALLAGAWTLPAEKRAVLVFANTGDAPVTAKVVFDATEWGLAKAPQFTPVTPEGAAVAPGEDGQAVFPPRSAAAWELR